ncbi:MAG: TOBE domain-containing protein [Acidobacteriota bacterium]|jgi:molybdopterin-binding protein|nr:TOBE domain-containing protein [Acidobacteriota bacterium]
MLSPGNQLRGTVESVVLGVELAHVVVRVSENDFVETFIPRHDAVGLGLQCGKVVTTTMKDSRVTISTDQPD